MGRARKHEFIFHKDKIYHESKNLNSEELFFLNLIYLSYFACQISQCVMPGDVITEKIYICIYKY